MKISICFGRKEGYLVFGDIDPSIQADIPVISKQRVGEVGYTFDVQDLLLNHESFTGMTAVGPIVIFEQQIGISRVAILETVVKEIQLPQDLYDLYRKKMEKEYSHLPGRRM